MASGHVRLALCDNTWWFAKLKRGYLYGQDTAEDRPPRSPESYQGAWLSLIHISHRAWMSLRSENSPRACERFGSFAELLDACAAWARE